MFCLFSFYILCLWIRPVFIVLGCPSWRIWSDGMKWIFVTQISCSWGDRGQWLWTQTLGVLMSCHDNISNLIFSSSPKWIWPCREVRTSFEQCEEWILKFSRLMLQLFLLLTLLTSVLIDETISSSHAWHWPADGCESLMTQLPANTNHLPSSHHYISCMLPQPHSLSIPLCLSVSLSLSCDCIMMGGVW